MLRNRDCVNGIKKDLELQINKSGSMSIIAQTQRTKLPYSLLKSVGWYAYFASVMDWQYKTDFG